MLTIHNQVLDEDYTLDTVSFIKEEINYFRLGCSHDLSVSVDIPFILQPFDQYDDQEFICHIFQSNKHYKESDIFQIYEKNVNNRIGWVFPIQALLSNEHSFANNEHFLKYAYIAFKNLITKEVNGNFGKIQVAGKELEMNLDDIYNSSLIILCLCVEQTNKVQNFNIDNYLPSLYLNQYYFFNDKTNVKSTHTTLGPFVDDIDMVPISKKKISSVKVNLLDENFIKFLFKNYLNVDQHPLVEFHLLYQVVELLIEKLLAEELKAISLTAHEKDPFELKDEIMGALTEINRIKKLFNEGVIFYSEKKLYCEIFNEFLVSFDKEELDLPSAIYKIRNIVVHRYREVIDKNLINRVVKINRALEEIVVSLLV